MIVSGSQKGRGCFGCLGAWCIALTMIALILGFIDLRNGAYGEATRLLGVGGTFLGILLILAWLLMLVDCLKGSRTDKTAWVIVLIFLPLLGVILYYFIAYKRPGDSK